MHADLLAGLGVGTIGKARLITALVTRLRSVHGVAAAQGAIVIHDVGAAAAIIAELRGLHFPSMSWQFATRTSLRTSMFLPV